MHFYDYIHLEWIVVDFFLFKQFNAIGNNVYLKVAIFNLYIQVEGILERGIFDLRKMIKCSALIIPHPFMNF